MIKYREMNRDIKGLDRNTKHFERGISHERGVLSKKLGDIDTIEGLEDIDDVEDDGFIDIGVSESVSTYRRTDYEDDYTYDSYIGRNTDYIRYNSADNEDYWITRDEWLECEDSGNYTKENLIKNKCQSYLKDK